MHKDANISRPHERGISAGDMKWKRWKRTTSEGRKTIYSGDKINQDLEEDNSLWGRYTAVITHKKHLCHSTIKSYNSANNLPFSPNLDLTFNFLQDTWKISIE